MTSAPPIHFEKRRDFLEELASRGEWIKLEEVAIQHLQSRSHELAKIARRYLVIALANQGDAKKSAEACKMAVDIVNTVGCEIQDFVRAVTLLYNEKHYNQSCELIKLFANRYSGQVHLVSEIGQKVYYETKDALLAELLGIHVSMRRDKV